MKLPSTLEFPVLIKILKKEYVDDLLDGKLYMNNLKYYVDLEKSTGRRGIGDVREASLANIQKHELFVQYDGGDRIKLDPGPAPGIIYDEEALYHPVFCSIGKVFCFGYIGNNRYTGKIFLGREEMEDFIGNSDGEYKAVIIFNCIEFLERIHSKKLPVKSGLIAYRDMRFPRVVDGNWYLDDTFTKDIWFSKQSEYRIELCQRSEVPYIMDIGDIRDCSIVVDCEKLVSGLFFTQAVEEML